MRYRHARLIRSLLLAPAVVVGLAAAGVGVPDTTPAVLNDAEHADVTHPTWFKESFLDLPEDLNEARRAGKTGILVFFSTRTCAYCRVFLETTFAEPDVVARVRKHFDVIGLEVLSDAEITGLDGRVLRVNEFAAKAKARLTPTMIFYGEGGRTLLHIVGQHPPDKFHAILDYLEGRHYESQTLRAFLAARATPTASSAGDIVRNPGFFAEPPHLLDRRAPGGRPLLVVFEQPGCAPCERLHATVLRDASVRNLLREFDAIQLNMADESSRLLTPAGKKLSPKAWADQLGLISVPALVFLDDRGAEVLRIDSEIGRYRLEGALQYVLEKGYLEQSQFQQWRRKKALESRSNGSSGARP